MNASPTRPHPWLLRCMVGLPQLGRPIGLLTRRLFRLLKLGWTARSGIRFHLESYSDWCTFNDIFIDGEYDEPIARVLDARWNDDRLHVLDLGANSGFFLLRLVDRARRRGFRGSIHALAVEGGTRNAARLRANLGAAALGNDVVVTVLQGLVGKKTGYGCLRELPFDAMSHVAKSGRAVPYVDLTPVLESWPRIDLLKCDIEGSEGDFIRTFPELLRKTPTAVFELHHAESPRIIESRALLKACGLGHRKILRTYDQNTVELFWR